MLKKFDGVEIIITKIQNIHKHAQLYMKDIQLIIMVIQMARKRVEKV